MRSTRNLGHRHIGLVFMLTTLFFKLHGVQTATQLCVMFPCNTFQRSFKSTNQLGTSEEEIDNWGYRSQLGDNELIEGQFRSIGNMEERGQERDAIPTLLERLRSIYGEGIPNRSLIMLLVQPPKCEPNVKKCASKGASVTGYNGPTLEGWKAPDKRSRMTSQRWSAAGLPFSVLYHKQVRARGGYGSNGGNVQDSQNAAPAPQRSTEGWSNHGVTTRRQYSTLPHLFVSYGWGPLGK